MRTVLAQLPRWWVGNGNGNGNGELDDEVVGGYMDLMDLWMDLSVIECHWVLGWGISESFRV